MQSLEKGELENWRFDHYGRLAYIILADQFPRCIYRGKAKAFALDEKALFVAEMVVNDFRESQYNRYRNAEKWLVLLPLVHTEDEATVAQCIEEYQRLADDAYESGYDAFVIAAGLAKKYGEAHLDPLTKFQRYPQRNKALGRADTPEEAEYLADEDNDDGTIK